MLPMKYRLSLSVQTPMGKLIIAILDLVIVRQCQVSRQSHSTELIPFLAEDSIISVNIAHFNFKALLDTGAAVTAISACAWQESVCDVSPNLDLPNHDSITRVDGYSQQIFGKMMLPFAVGFENSIPFEANVIQDLTSKVILGKNFSQKNCGRIDFDQGMIKFK